MEFTEKHSSIIIPFLCLLCGLGARNSVDLTEEQDLPTPRPQLTLSQQLQLCPELIGLPQPLDSVKLRPNKYFCPTEHVYLPKSHIQTSE